jgi:Domain of unknown function (DUF5655)/Domain of unknown function (DUF4287)
MMPDKITAKAKRSSPYSVHPGFKMEAAYAENLLKRTGKTLDEWVTFAKRSGPGTTKERREWLKAQGLTTNYAWWISDVTEGKNRGVDDYDPEAFVEAMFSGKKAALRPIYDKLLKLALSIGTDVTASPGKTIVPLYRQHVFAQIKPTTNTRLDLGLALGALKATGRLISTGGFEKKDRITHRIPISSIDEIDADVKAWLKKAYALDAPA